MDSEHFNIYEDKKYILAYSLSFKTYYVGSNSSKSYLIPKTTHFNFTKTKNIPKFLQQ